MRTTFEVAGVIVPGRGASLFGVKNHPNRALIGDHVFTSNVKSVKYDQHGRPVLIVTQNTTYHREQ